MSNNEGIKWQNIPTSNPSKISNGTKSKNVNTLLDFVSDAALVTPKITDQLQIEDQQKRLNVSKAIQKPVTTLSEFVDFSL